MILKLKCPICDVVIGEREKEIFSEFEIEETKETTRCTLGHEISIEVE